MWVQKDPQLRVDGLKGKKAYMVNQFYDFITRPNLLEKLSVAIDSFYVEGYPFTTYFGVNYQGAEIVSVKFYIVFFDKVSPTLLSELFPDFSPIDRLYSRYEPSKEYNLSNLGVTLAIKINAAGELAYSYYQLDKENILPSPTLLPWLPLSKVIRANLRSVEFNSALSYSKNYYMFEHEPSIASCLKEFSLDVKPEEIKFVEYSEFDGKQKMVLVFKDPHCKDIFENLFASDELLELKFHLQGRFGFHSDYPGLYKGGRVKKTYFFKKDQHQDFFQSPDTIRSLLNALA